MSPRTKKRTISVDEAVDAELEKQASPSRYLSALVLHHREWREAHASLLQTGWHNRDLLAAGAALQGTHIARTTGHRLSWMADALFRYHQQANVQRTWGIDPDHWQRLVEVLASNELVAILLKLVITELHLGNTDVERTLRARMSPVMIWRGLTDEQRRLAGTVAVYGPMNFLEVMLQVHAPGDTISKEDLEYELGVLEAVGILRHGEELWSVVPTYYNVAHESYDVVITQGVPEMPSIPSSSRVPDPNGVFASASFLLQRALPLVQQAGIDVEHPIINGRRGYMWRVCRAGQATWIFFSRIHGDVLSAESPNAAAEHCMKDMITYSMPERSHRAVPPGMSLEQAFVEGLNRLLV